TVQGGEKSFTLERSSGRGTAEITASGDGLIVQSGNQSLRISELRAPTRGKGAVEFALAIPEKMSRRYRGMLEVKALAGILVPVVQMDLETAVASVLHDASASH